MCVNARCILSILLNTSYSSPAYILNTDSSLGTRVRALNALSRRVRALNASTALSTRESLSRHTFYSPTPRITSNTCMSAFYVHLK